MSATKKFTIQKDQFSELRRALAHLEKTLVFQIRPWAPGTVPRDYDPCIENKDPHWSIMLKQVEDKEGKSKLYFVVKGKVELPDALTRALVWRASTYGGARVPELFPDGLYAMGLLLEDDTEFSPTT